MGLPVVLGIVRAHEGVITVESEPGRGSIFRIYLPLAAKEASQPRNGPGGLGNGVLEIAGQAGGGVLLVEDEEKVRKVVASMLIQMGFSVLVAKDGVEAVEVFRQRQDEIRLVLCDLSMPRMDGLETLTALRKIAPGIPAILASGYGEAQIMDRWCPERPQAILGKPYQRDQLLAAIRKALA